MSSTARFRRRPWARALWCLFGASVAQAQLPATAAEPTAADAAGSGRLEPATVANVNDFARPLTSTNLSGYSLDRCIALTLRNYPRIHEARARLGYRREQQVQSWSQPYSEFN